MGGMGSILGMGAMLQKVFIPSYVPVLASAATLAVEKLIETGVMLLFLLVLLNVGWTWLLFPFLLVVLWVFSSAFSYCLAVAIVHFRDTGQIVGDRHAAVVLPHAGHVPGRHDPRGLERDPAPHPCWR